MGETAGETLHTDFGPIGYREGDYLVVPRGTVYRLYPDAPTRLLVVESADEVALTDAAARVEWADYWKSWSK